jgi:putative endonuclease
MYYVYILTNKTNNVLYTGVTHNLVKRVYEHKNKITKGFTSKYNVNKLVYYEAIDEIIVAIEREKEIKGWIRERKIELVRSKNPEWNDLYDEICR